jgi:hypothetical protein
MKTGLSITNKDYHGKQAVSKRPQKPFSELVGELVVFAALPR